MDPRGREFTLNIATLQDGLTAQWFNPRTGERLDVGSSISNRLTTPDDKDWVLILS